LENVPKKKHRLAENCQLFGLKTWDASSFTEILSSLKVNPGVEFRRASQGVLTVPLFEVSNSSAEIRISKKTLFAIRPWNKFNCICGCSVVFRAWQYGV